MDASTGADAGARVDLSDAALLAAFGAPDGGTGTPPVSRHETHGSRVFVVGDRAYKLKKPVALGFLDYSTLARRRAACREEVRVNRALAPGVYLGVHALVRDGEGLRLAGEDALDAIEYVVEMRAFDERETLAGLVAAGELTCADVEDAARAIADFHRHAEVDREWGPERLRARWRRNLVELERVPPPARWHVDVAGAFAEAFVERRAQELRERAARGLARDGHGDLRCEHVLVRPLRIVDRIEFDPMLRRSDVAADLAFLGMDLEALGRRWAADLLYEAYARTGLDISDRAMRAFYAAHWAIVRAKVALISAGGRDGEARSGQLETAERMWSLAEHLCWRARQPLAIVVCGPAASGKSRLAGALAERSQVAAISSDAVRKRLAGLQPEQRAGAEQYSEAYTRATYERLGAEAQAALAAGGQALLDATFRARARRASLLAALRAGGARTLLVRCEVPLAVALERAERRLAEPGRVSDATPEIVARQYREFEEPDAGEADAVLALDTTAALDAQLADVARAADRALA